MIRFSVLSFCLLISAFVWADASSTTHTWYKVAFEEIDFASPVVAEANLTPALGNAFIAALPDVWLTEIKDEGFDLKQLTQNVTNLDENETHTAKTESYQLDITRVEKATEGNTLPTYLVVETPDARIPIPLFVTTLAVNGLIYIVEEFKGKEKELGALIEEIKRTPTGLLYEQVDHWDQSWMKVTLE